MAEQRRPFRFRLPWLSAMNVPRPTPEPQLPRPTPEIQTAPQPITSAPIQRPPFRSAGIAPTQPPPQTQPVPRAEPLPPISYSSPTESRVASQPASPSGATPTQAASVPPGSQVTSQPSLPSRATTQTRSPSQAATQSRAASVPPSTLRTASQTRPAIQAGVQPRSPSPLAPLSTGTSSQPSSPMGKPTQEQPTARAVSKAPSPPKNSQPSTQDTSQPPLNLYPVQPSAAQEQEPKPAAAVQLLEEPQLETQIKSDIVSETQIQSGANTTFKPDSGPEKPTQASDLETIVVASTLAQEAPVAPKKLESVVAKVDPPRTLSESEKILKETEGKNEAEELVKEAKSEDKKKVARELVKKEKSDGSADEERGRTVTKFITGASGLETQNKSKELFGARIRTEERKQEKHEIFQRKKPRATSIADEKHITTLSSTNQKDRCIVENHQKPAISKGERAPLHKEIRDDVSKFAHKLAIGHPKLPINGRLIKIITVAGENKGASMNLCSESAKKDESVHIRRCYKLKSDGISEATTDGEGSSREKSHRDPTTKNDEAPRAYINSNAQSINNSILFSCSVNERNPGVHMVHSHSLAETAKSTIKPETLETRKAESSIIPAENLTYQPTVRRRCLRGLFMEPSDSDPDNPDKPRRHGCLYNCGKKIKD